MNRVVQRLWDWADKEGNWARKLVHIVTTSSFVKEENRSRILNTLLYEKGLLLEYDMENIDAPVAFTHSPNQKKLILTNLSSIQGVNRLAKEQELNFSPNLTVIYGNNGSGKSGYGRILKSLGFSYDINTKVLSNVFNSDETEQKAHIEYKYGESNKSFIWDNSQDSSDLKNIAMFSSDCVKISLDNNRKLIATPSGFHFFNEVSSELKKLRDEIQKIQDGKAKELDFKTNLHDGTSSFKFIATLCSQTSKETIERETYFNEENEHSIRTLLEEKEKLNVQLIKNEINTYSDQERELSNLIMKITKMKEALNKTIWDNYIAMLHSYQKLREKRTLNINEAILVKGGSIVESTEFISFLEKAEKYIKVLDGDVGNYPNDNDVCIYCGQTFDEYAIELVRSYRSLINNSSKTKEDELKKELDDIITNLIQLDSSCILHHNPFDLIENKNDLPDELSVFIKKFNLLKNSIVSREEDLIDQSFELDYGHITNFVEARKKEITALKKEKLLILDRIQEKNKNLTSQLNELYDRRHLSINKQKIFDYVSDLNYIEKLDEIKSSLNTRIISRISTQAREELIQNQFKDTFEKELLNLRCEIAIALNFGTQAGSPILRQTIGSRYSLSDVLSEGEQKSIALAHLLTELQVSNQNGPVIFDDPVNSLDHERINIVAHRLIKLSQERQVIILTHNILFFFAIEQYIRDRKPKIDYKYYTVEPKLEYTGFLYKNTPPHKERFKTYVGRIKNLLNTSEENKDLMGSKAAIDGYGYLRSAIELLVEDEIFKSTIKRYRRNIMFGQIEEINGQQFDNIKSELTDIFNEACAYIDAHSNPQETAFTPNLKRLESDLNRVVSIKGKFK